MTPGVLVLESPSLCISIGWVFKPYAAVLGVSLLGKVLWGIFYLSSISSKLYLMRIVFGLAVGCGYPAVFAFGHIFRTVSESTSSLFRLPVRFSIYLLVWFGMLASCPAALGWGPYGVCFFIGPALAAAAGGLYGLAWYLGHELVHSRLLGHSGIEPMAEGIFGLESESGPVGPGQIQL